MNRYETMLIIDPTLDQDKVESLISRYEGMIKADGEIISIDPWGKKRLAYPIKKKPTGFYVLYKYKAGYKVPQTLVDDMNINSSVLRYMTLVVDKRAMKQEQIDLIAAGKELKKEEAENESVSEDKKEIN
ncbi:MAG: 30S ribosomal protein S6 [Candidatus Delongbacteria bacterium]|nr:30S ribosomal protein S6 [Candidatus Delongbacteria bacterium]MCG2760683.1 30S ribosomal protein S6 [Candidatus Delongbacteria bacterium]